MFPSKEYIQECIKCQKELVEELIHGEEGVLDLIWIFVEGAIGVEPIIARILKAVVDGMSLPGERDRLNIAVDGCVIGVKKGDTIIALSPEGQEEEG